MAACRVAPEDSGPDRGGFVADVAVDSLPLKAHTDANVGVGFEPPHALNSTREPLKTAVQIKDPSPLTGSDLTENTPCKF